MHKARGRAFGKRRMQTRPSTDIDIRGGIHLGRDGPVERDAARLDVSSRSAIRKISTRYRIVDT